MDVYGDHAICCNHGTSRVFRHNNLRDILPCCQSSRLVSGHIAGSKKKPGDIIQEVNRQPVKSVEDLRSALKKSTDRPTLLLINRQGSDIFVTVRSANG